MLILIACFLFAQTLLTDEVAKGATTFGDEDRKLLQAVGTARQVKWNAHIIDDSRTTSYAHRFSSNCVTYTKPQPDLKWLVQLKSKLCTANRVWLNSFIENEGLTALVRAFDFRLARQPMSEMDAAMLFELMCGCRAIMNNSTGLESMVKTGVA